MVMDIAIMGIHIQRKNNFFALQALEFEPAFF